MSYAKCCDAKRLYAERLILSAVMFNDFMLSVIMLNIFTLSVVMLIVIAQLKQLLSTTLAYYTPLQNRTKKS